jgi:pyruvate dehydrogenase E2 component (dihydrolipoamide acetyltransferase)
MSKIFTVNLPDIGEGVVEGEVIEWLKKVGDEVSLNEPVVVVMTDKATVELPAPYPGKIAKHYFQPGQMAQKDWPLYDIALKEERKDVEREEKKEIIKSPVKHVPIKAEQPALPSREKGEKALAVPYVRKMAKDLGLDLNKISGTGREGSVTEEDLKRFLAEKASPLAPALPGDKTAALIGVRRLMAKKMQESHANIPPFSYFEQADATHLIQLREKLKKEAVKEGIHLTFMPFFLKALSLTIKKFPLINSSLDAKGQQFILHQPHHIGIAMASASGLIVPVLKNVDTLKLEELVKAYASLKQRALDNKLAPHEMRDGTITLSNYGVDGGRGLWATPIINFPEVAILAVARIQKQPTVKNGEVMPRDMLNLSWSFDHRVIDGDLAAAVSRYFAQLIQNPAALL